MQVHELLRKYFAEYGYWTVAVILLLENVGIPLPGETTLLFAAFLAFSEHRLTLWGIIVVGVVACTIGDNIGYWIGYRGGRSLLDRTRRRPGRRPRSAPRRAPRSAGRGRDRIPRPAQPAAVRSAVAA